VPSSKTIGDEKWLAPPSAPSNMWSVTSPAVDARPYVALLAWS
jgi:hypothetical protein